MEKKSVFYTHHNNGVWAVVPESVYTEQKRRDRLVEQAVAKGLPRPQLAPAGPVFTFSSQDHPCLYLMTGTIELMNRLFMSGRYEFREGGIWVPFSNGFHVDPTMKESAEWERKMFVTTGDELVDAFDLLPALETLSEPH